MKKEHNHDCHGCQHNHDHHNGVAHVGKLAVYRNEIISLLLLVIGMLASRFGWFEPVGGALGELVWYLLALAPVGVGIVKETVEAWAKGDFFNEFSLMTLACVGAFVIGEYPEGVAVLLFYSFGEKLEETASGEARGRIKSLLAKLPDEVTLADGDGGRRRVKPEEVAVGDLMIVKPGERVAVDGILEGDFDVTFDNSAITGESVPVETAIGARVSSGAIAVDREASVRATCRYADSTMSRIMGMIEDAASKKSRSETLLRRITRWYTPVVMVCTVALFLIPWLVALVGGEAFDWKLWLNRSLVLLVCSCPCALVVSVPLSYFAAIGSASRMGVLLKGSRYLDALRSIDTLLLDKTGTITTGKFHVAGVRADEGFTTDEVLALAAAIDAGSTHPLAKAIVEKAGNYAEADDVVTVAHGMEGMVDGRRVLVGSRKLMERHGVVVGSDCESGMSEVCVAVDGRFAGSIYLSDTLKPDTAEAFARLRWEGVRRIEILSGDRNEAVAAVAHMAGADSWHGELLPGDKQFIVNDIREKGGKVAFVGDGINDSPSLASADVGIAIGTGGTDIAMESGDAVLMGNSLGALADVVGLSHRVKHVVGFNVALAIGVKVAVMVLGACGLATLWAAVFADTGITLITVVIALAVLGKKH